MKRRLLLLMLLPLAGCAAVRGADKVEVMRLAPPPPPLAALRRPGTVVLAPVEAQGFAAQRRYTYVLAADPLVLHQAATLFWEVPPVETVAAALRAALDARLAGSDPGAAVIAHLTARLARFEEVSGDGHAEATVALDMGLRETGASARYCRTTPIAASASGARAGAFQASIAAVAAAVAADVAAGRLTGGGC